MISENEAVNILNSNPFCIFFGSGISKEAGLPDGLSFARKILLTLGISMQDSHLFSKEYHLERMLFLLSTDLGPLVSNVYLALKTNDFGINHLALSKMSLRMNIPLITTNQDELVEESSPNKLSNLVKVHGTLSDLNSLRVTLDKVSKLPFDMLNRIKEVTKNKIILVIGYSFSDYDLKDFFSTNRDRIIYYGYDENSVEKFCKLFDRENSKTFFNNCIKKNSEFFLVKLCESLNIDIQHSVLVDKAKVEKLIEHRLEEWKNKFKPIQIEIAIARLGKGLWEGESTYKIMKNIAEKSDTPVFYKLIALADASNAAESINEYNSQIQLLKRIKKIDNIDKNLKNFIYYLYKANFHHIQDNPCDWIMALRLYKKSKIYQNKVLMMNLTPEEKNYILNHSKGIDHGIASSSVKLNRIFFKKKRFKKAFFLMNYYLESDSITCDLDHLCEVLFIRGKLNLSIKNYQRAEKDYREALEIALWIKKVHSIIQSLRGLGRILSIQGKYEEAINYIKESENLKTGEPILKARTDLALASVYNKMLIHHKKKGVSIFKKHRGFLKGYFDAFFYFKGGN